MSRRVTRTAFGLVRIAFGLPVQVCLELRTAADNVWVWVLCEWDAAREGR